MTRATVPYKVETRIIAEPKKKRTQSVYLSWKEKVELMKECGDAAVILMEFYFKGFTDNRQAFTSYS